MTGVSKRNIGLILANLVVIILATTLVMRNRWQLGVAMIIVLFLANIVAISALFGTGTSPRGSHEAKIKAKRRLALRWFGLGMIAAGVYGFIKVALGGVSLSILTGAVSSSLLGALFLLILKKSARHSGL